MIPRFTRTERVLHWTFAISFLTAMLTGIALFFPGLVPAGHFWLKYAHYASAALMIAAPIAVFLFGDRRVLLRGVREVDRWSAEDHTWLRDFFKRPRRVLNGGGPPSGRLNAGQKLNTIAMAASTMLFLITGLMMFWSRYLPGFWSQNAIFLHDLLTWILLILVTGHIFLAAVYPTTRESLRGMITGSVHEDWARRHHSKWTASAPEKQPDSSQEQPDSPKGSFQD